MLIEFKHLTPELNDQQRRLCYEFVSVLRAKVGKENAITSTKLIEEIKIRTGYPFTGSSVRKMISYIRRRALIEGLIASSNGYYLAANEEEFLESINSLNDRIDSITAVRDALMIQFEQKYHKMIVRHKDPNGSSTESVSPEDYPPPTQKEFLFPNNEILNNGSN